MFPVRRPPNSYNVGPNLAESDHNLSSPARRRPTLATVFAVTVQRRDRRRAVSSSILFDTRRAPWEHSFSTICTSVRGSR